MYNISKYCVYVYTYIYIYIYIYAYIHTHIYTYIHGCSGRMGKINRGAFPANGRRSESPLTSRPSNIINNIIITTMNHNHN